MLGSPFPVLLTLHHLSIDDIFVKFCMIFRYFIYPSLESHIISLQRLLSDISPAFTLVDGTGGVFFCYLKI